MPIFGISGFTEVAPRSKARSASAKKVHEGHYPTRGNLDFMDPGELDYEKYSFGLRRGAYKGKFRTVEEVLEGEQVGRETDPVDFRDHLAEATADICEICGGYLGEDERGSDRRICIHNCRRADTEAMTAFVGVVALKTGEDEHGELFELIMRYSLAEELGLAG